MQIVTMSSKGQITIPVDKRKLLKKHKKFLIVMKGSTIILKPIEIKVVDDLQGFGDLSAESFNFWDNTDDDIYQEYYNL